MAKINKAFEFHNLHTVLLQVQFAKTVLMLRRNVV